MVDQPIADALVLFGATGDLAKRKLFPALYELERRGVLAVPVIGVARSDWSDDDFRLHARESVTAAQPDADPAVLDRFIGRLDLIQGDYSDPATWAELRNTLDRYDSTTTVFYMAIPLGSALGYLIGGYVGDKWSWRTALFVAAIPLAGVIGNPVSGGIMDLLSGAMGLAGWQWLFLVEGIPSILVGVWVMYYLDSSIVEARWLSDEEKALLASNLDAEERHKGEHRLIDAFKSTKVYALCAIYFTLMIGLYGIAFWLPTIVKAFGLQGYLAVGMISAIPYGVATIGMLLLSRHSDRTGERRIPYACNVTLGAFGLVLSGVFASNPVINTIGLSLAALGVIGSMPLFWPIPSAFLTGTAAAAGIGIVNSIGNLGGYVGPNVAIWLKPFSADPSAALYVIAALLILGGIICLVAIPKSLVVRVSRK